MKTSLKTALFGAAIALACFAGSNNALKGKKTSDTTFTIGQKVIKKRLGD